MKRVFGLGGLALLLTGCTFGSVSAIPMEVAGVGTVYKYEGRANFPHQIAEGDRMITEDCKARNGGHPVIVDLQKSVIGKIDFGSSQSQSTVNATVTGYGNGAKVSGAIDTTTSNDSSSIDNVNQVVYYKCVKD
ncbi:MAG: hypothetical protein ABL973_11195 [Micropepsaceae bacterium]